MTHFKLLRNAAPEPRTHTEIMKDIYQVIKNVRLSEKASMLQETNNEVTLEVDRKANKLSNNSSEKPSSAFAPPTTMGNSAVNAVLMPAAPTTGKKPSSV